MTAPGALLYFESRARTYRHQWRGTVISSFANPIMFLAAMGLGLGTLVDAGATGTASDISYLSFLAPGLLAATMMQSATSDSAWPVMAGAANPKGAISVMRCVRVLSCHTAKVLTLTVLASLAAAIATMPAPRWKKIIITGNCQSWMAVLRFGWA